MGFVLIAGLVLLVCHAAAKVNAAEAAASATQATSLPPNTAIAATGTTPTPSPASAQGAPGAAANFEVKLNTNTTYPTSLLGAYTVSGTFPGQAGIPQNQVPGMFQAGFNSQPETDAALATQTRPRRLNSSNFNIAQGIPYRL